jgi:hypothetical protein
MNTSVVRFERCYVDCILEERGWFRQRIVSQLGWAGLQAARVMREAEAHEIRS